MIVEWVTGEVCLSFPGGCKREVFEIIASLDVPFRDARDLSGSFSLYVPLYRKRALVNALHKRGIDAVSGATRGLFPILFRYRKRVGIPLGILLFFLMVWLSGRVIWCIDIKGNTVLSDAEIKETLRELGCCEGALYGEIDFDLLHNRFLMECPDIAWIAVNMNGTHANVEVREYRHGEREEDKGFYNIVAGEAGQIERVAAREGKPVVEIFDTVEKGDLLISGAISYKQDTMNRFESADGQVFARVWRSFDLRVPFSCEEKTYTGEETEKKTFIFFDFEINLFRNSRIPYEFCDKITVSKQIHLFDSLPLPLYINKTVYRQYVTKTVERTPEKARDIAVSLYRERLTEVLGSGELITKTVEEKTDKDGLYVACRIYCIDDIGKKVPLGISRGDENSKLETEK